MRIAVLSDIHGNLPALRAVLADIDSWRPDLVILNGDLVNRGPSSLECLEIIAVMREASAALTGRCDGEPLNLPLLEHLAEVVLDGAAVDVPLERFFGG